MSEKGVRYPKNGKHPSAKVGETHTSDWPEHKDNTYPGGGPSSTTYNGDKSKTLHCGGGSGGASPKTYPKKNRQGGFGTVVHQGG